MAIRKVTLSLPADLADELTRKVPARERSKYVARALRESLKRSDQAIARACLLANQDQDGEAIEKEFDALHHEIAEPWDEPATR